MVTSFQPSPTHSIKVEFAHENATAFGGLSLAERLARDGCGPGGAPGRGTVGDAGVGGRAQRGHRVARAGADRQAATDRRVGQGATDLGASGA